MQERHMRSLRKGLMGNNSALFVDVNAITMLS